jgi:SPP1 family predicted phage head-tail adaptor
MRAGKLTHSITIERLVEGLDDYGVPRPTWTPIATVRAEILTASTSEFLTGAGEGAASAIVFRIRYMEGVTPADRITLDGKGAYDIKEIKQIGRRRGLEIRATVKELRT